MGMRTSNGFSGAPDARAGVVDRSTAPFWRGVGLTPPLAVLPGSLSLCFDFAGSAVRALGISGGQTGGVRSSPTNVQSSSGYLERRPAISLRTFCMRARMAAMVASSGSTGGADVSLAEGGACQGGRKSSGGCMTGACEAQIFAGDSTGGEEWLMHPTLASRAVIGDRLLYSIGGRMSYSAG